MLTVDNGYCKIPEGTECLDSADIFKGIEQQIKVLYIPASVKKINPDIFMNLKSLWKFKVDENNDYFLSFDSGALYAKNERKLIKWPPANEKESVSIPYAFMNHIGEYAFAGCSKINSITINKNITKIPDSAFEGCEGLRKIKFEDISKLTDVGKKAFCGCKKLETILFPMKLISIKADAFKDCANLQTIVLPDDFFGEDGNIKEEYYCIFGMKDTLDLNSAKCYSKFLAEKDSEIASLKNMVSQLRDNAGKYKSKLNETLKSNTELSQLNKELSRKRTTETYKELNREIYKKLKDVKEHYKNGDFEYCRKQLRYALELTINHLCRLYGYDYYSRTLSSKMADIKSVFEQAGKIAVYENLDKLRASGNNRSHAPKEDNISIDRELYTSSAVKDDFRCFRQYYKTVFPSLHEYAVNHKDFDESLYVKDKGVSLKIDISILEKDILKRKNDFEKYNMSLKKGCEASGNQPNKQSSMLTLSEYDSKRFYDDVSDISKISNEGQNVKNNNNSWTQDSSICMSSSFKK